MQAGWGRRLVFGSAWKRRGGVNSGCVSEESEERYYMNRMLGCGGRRMDSLGRGRCAASGVRTGDVKEYRRRREDVQCGEGRCGWGQICVMAGKVGEG